MIVGKNFIMAKIFNAGDVVKLKNGHPIDSDNKVESAYNGIKIGQIGVVKGYVNDLRRPNGVIVQFAFSNNKNNVFHEDDLEKI